MKLAVTHLTRMQRGYVCVAGVDVDSGVHVRPVIPNARLRDQLCARRGGPFDMATVVDLGTVRAVPKPPEVEDHEFTPWHARAVQQIEPLLFWEMLCFLAKPGLNELFGPALRPAGRGSAVVEVGAGTASLGCIAPVGRPRLVIEERPDRNPSIRLQFSDGALPLNLSVTDLRLWEDDHVTPRLELIEDVARRLNFGVPCLLSVGLTRPFTPTAGDAPVHWLQVNSIHLTDDPCWRLADELPPATEPHCVTSNNGVRQPSASIRGTDDLPF